MSLEALAAKLKTLPPDSQERKALGLALKKIEQRKLFKFTPYPWQKDFFDHGGDYAQRLLMAANGVGKTICGAVETSYHLTGRYPTWWKGRRFEKAVLGMRVGETKTVTITPDEAYGPSSSRTSVWSA